MKDKPKVVVIIPALNEEKAIGKVLDEVPKGLVDEMIVVDNGSTDGTAEVAKGRGATIVYEPRRGYGNACLAGIARVKEDYDDEDTVVVFLDGDHSDFPDDIGNLIGPVRDGRFDMVVGSRFLGGLEKDAMGVHGRLGNMIIIKVLSILLRRDLTDLGPFRAIRLRSLLAFDMQERTFGWTTEMTVKAVHKGLKWKEVSVRYRKRIGKAKISGSFGSGLSAIFGILKAGMKYHLGT